MKAGPQALGLLSAILFGIATPASKALLGDFTPLQLAGTLYLGASLGMLPFALRPSGREATALNRRNIGLLSGAILFGGMLGPLLLLLGLKLSTAGSVSLFLNLEPAITALLGVTIFKEHLHRAGALGVAGIVAAGSLVSIGGGWPGTAAGGLVALACLSWAVDNHCTALIDNLTPSQTTCAKGLVAGAMNLGIGALLAPLTPRAGAVLAALLVGAFSYGLSIVLYVQAAQRLGATRAQGLFAVAPFVGAALSFAVLGEPLNALQIVAAVLLGFSVVALLRSHHEHMHDHEGLDHVHPHRHDDGHHLHEHPGLPPSTEHTHWHHHDPLHHSHSHQPDLHHRHRH